MAELDGDNDILSVHSICNQCNTYCMSQNMGKHL